jgi:hypothetical protein
MYTLRHSSIVRSLLGGTGAAKAKSAATAAGVMRRITDRILGRRPRAVGRDRFVNFST